MRVHLIIDLTPDGTKRQSFSEVSEELESELESLVLEVGEQTYELKVLGVGKNAREVDESFKLRAQLH